MSKQTILLAEDNPANQNMLSILLERLGYDVVIANNGQQAVDLLAGQSFALVLMDIYMPRMDGFAATQAIRALPIPKCDVPIIAISADTKVETQILMTKTGANDFLGKPINSQALSSAIEKWLWHYKDPIKQSIARQNVDR